MEKTTVYMDGELKAALKAAARQRGTSEAEVIRESIRTCVAPVRPAPRPALFTAEPIAERVDELLAGFGER
ncbi:MAG TPA: ribbon-helix-helix protein, CopG family [Cryptosporangiaceae bacterium]|nr:ribbon-helix-helix protein, CopG family [Cryptosporangiaceae bacterium]